MAHDAVRDDVHFQSPKNGTGELAYHWHEAEISCRTHGTRYLIRVYPDEPLSSDVEMRPIRVDFGANATYRRDHMLMGHSGGAERP